MRLRSTAFDDHGPIGSRYTVEGADSTPPLEWQDVPREARTLALVCDDPDAPSPRHPAPEPWVHWILFNIPASATGLPEGIDRTGQPTDVPGARQGTNSWPRDNLGYRGPAPPHASGPHRYVFHLFALDTVLDLPVGATKKQLLQAMQDHVLAECQLVGIFER